MTRVDKLFSVSATKNKNALRTLARVDLFLRHHLRVQIDVDVGILTVRRADTIDGTVFTHGRVLVQRIFLATVATESRQISVDSNAIIRLRAIDVIIVIRIIDRRDC